MVARFGTKTLSYDPFRNQLLNSQSEHVLRKCTDKPLFSIVVPVYKVAPKWLNKCVSSVVHQHYTNWELILIDDASEQAALRQLMDKWSSKDGRIRVFYLDENGGAAGVTNFGARQAKGKFIGILDHDDELTADALTWICWFLNKNPDTLWFYSDEDKITTDGKCHSPYFKPDFSPEFLLSNMYTCHFRVYAKEVFDKAGGIRDGFEGAQDHDLALRLSEIVPKEKVVHIPRVLYHWREISSSAASGNFEKPLAAINGRKAIEQALERRSIKATVKSHPIFPTLYQVELEPSIFPKVTIIIPTKNSLSDLKKCINSVRQYTSYPNYEILIIDNNSDDPAFFDYIKKQQLAQDFNVLKYTKTFNHSEMNNIAVTSVDSELIVFMNNDVEIVSNNWLEQLVAVTQFDESIAMVGGLLLYPDGKVQHGGVILGLNGYAGHAHKHMDSMSTGYFGRLCSIQQVSGITAALALIRKTAFEDTGGFNAERYPASFNDVDLAIRLNQKGFRAIYNPMVKAIHYESKSREVSPEERIYQQRLMSDYGEILNNDPFYNPNLTLNNEQFDGLRLFPVEEQMAELKKSSTPEFSEQNYPHEKQTHQQIV